MARTPLADSLEQLVRAVAAEEAAGPGTSLPGTTRRGLLAGGAGLAAAAAATRFAPLARGATAPRIAVVGAGLAGLTCAYRLKQAGYTAKVYEASNRVGGRCWTIRGFFAEGQIAEHGGELIDQGHTQIRHLASQLGLKLDNLLAAEENGTEPFYYFDGHAYSYEEATDDIKGIWQQLHKDVSAASYPTLYNVSTERGVVLDNMSIRDWIETYVPGGIDSKLGQLLDVAYNIEYGAETTDQSALNMLYLLAYSGQGQLRIFGPSNEKYHVRGGNDQITDRLADALEGQIKLGKELVEIHNNGDGTWRLTFELSSGGTRSVTADRVVLALPFSILRSSVDILSAGFSELKRTAIENQGMGTNSKLHVQFTKRYWNKLGCNGDTFADTGYQNSWDVTRAQPGKSGILVNYTGGDVGASFGVETPDFYANQFLTQIEPVLPGISDRENGLETLDFWPGYPWTKGSYSYWKVGQYHTFAGIEREPEGTCHFAGEHTSVDFQGYLNGAVETGERAAGEIVAALG
jgi:monoamine oxidase